MPGILSWGRTRPALFLSVIVVLLLGVALLWVNRPEVTVELSPDRTLHMNGHLYQASLDVQLFPLYGIRSDNNDAPTRSSLQLFEDGRPLGPAHALHSDIAEVGGGAFSHWNGVLYFSASDNSNPLSNGRTYTARATANIADEVTLIVVGAGMMFAVWLLYCSIRSGRERDSLAGPFGVIFFLVSIAGMASVVYYFGIANAVLPVMVPDSANYLFHSIMRTPGAYWFYSMFDMLPVDWRYLPIFQAVLLAAALCLVGYGVGRVTRNMLWGAAFLFFAFQLEELFSWSLFILTEAGFAIALCLHLAGMLLLFRIVTLPRALLAGGGLAALILFKSIGIVLIAPAILSLLLIRSRRWLVVICIALPVAGALLVPSALNYRTYGVFKTAAFGGMALSGHVAWAVKADPTSEYPELSARIEERLKPVYADNPETEGLDDYIHRTMQQYNTGLWGNLWPETVEYFYPEGRPRGADIKLNDVLSTIAIEAIKRDPVGYGYHVFAHYWAMSTRPFSKYSQVLLSNVNVSVRQSPTMFDHPVGFWQDRLDISQLNAKHGERPKQDAAVLGFTELRQKMLGPFSEQVYIYVRELQGSVTWVLSLIACFLIFIFPKLSPTAAAFCYSGLVYNAYCLGHALAQVYLPRYASMSQPAAILILFLGLVLGVQMVRGLIGWRKRSRPAASEAGTAP